MVLYKIKSKFSINSEIFHGTGLLYTTTISDEKDLLVFASNRAPSIRKVWQQIIHLLLDNT